MGGKIDNAYDAVAAVQKELDPSSSFEDFQHSFETENWALVHGVGELNGGRYVFMYAKDEGLIVNGIGISDEEVLALL